MAELTSLKNIGREMARKLTAAGIDSPEALTAAGSREAFFRLKTLFPQVCLVHLYALEGAIQGEDFNRLPDSCKRDLKAFSDALKGSPRSGEERPSSAKTPFQTEESL